LATRTHRRLATRRLLWLAELEKKRQIVACFKLVVSIEEDPNCPPKFGPLQLIMEK
jgi:hypothetical protein